MNQNKASGSQRRENFYKNVMSTAVYRLITPICAFLTRTAFIYLLGMKYVGISGLFTDILNVLSLSELGISSAITYALYRPLAEDDQEKITQLMLFFKTAYRVIGIAIMGIGCAIMPFVPQLISKDAVVPVNIFLVYFVYLLNTAISYFFFSYRTVLLTAAQKNYREQIVNTVTSIIYTAILIGILFLSHNFMLYLIVQLILGIIKNIIVAHIVNQMFPHAFDKTTATLDIKEMRVLWKNVYSVFVGKISGTIFTSADSMIISKCISTISVGILSNYRVLIAFATSICGLFTGGMLPAVGEMAAKESPEECEKRFSKYNFIQMWVTSVIAICLMAVLTPFIRLWAGEKNMLSQLTVAALVLNFWMDLILQMVYQFRAAYGLYPYGKYLQLIASVINIFVSIWWAGYWGIFGVLFATSVLNSITFIYPYFLYKYGFECSSRKYYKSLFQHFLITVAAQGLVILLCRYSFKNLVFDLIIRAVVSFLLSNMVLLICYHKSEGWNFMKRELYSVIKKLIKNKRQ